MNFKGKKYICLPILICLFHGLCFAGSVTVTDQAGRRVRVRQPVNRVVTTFIPATLFALCADLSDQIVGASNKDGTVSIFEALTDPEHPPVLVGNRSAGLSLETIFSLKPDLVIMYGQKDGVRLADRLTSMGVPAVVILPETMASVGQALDLIGRASGRTAHTDKVIRAMEEIENRLSRHLEGCTSKKVYYASSRLLSTVSGDMLQNEMIRRAGGVNVSEHTHGFYVTVTQEQLLSWNPEVIIESDRLSRTAGTRLFSPPLSSVQAVRDKAVFKVPVATYWDFPSPLAMAGVIWMAGHIHPEIVSKQQAVLEIEQLYDTMFGDGFSRRHPGLTGRRLPK